MDIENKEEILMQTVKKEKLDVEERKLFPEEMENAVCVTNIKSESNPLDYESYDNYERDIKTEAVFFDENNEQIVEQKVQVKSETSICDDYNVYIVDNLLGDYVKDEIKKGTCNNDISNV